jgi:hypothetical protein
VPRLERLYADLIQTGPLRPAAPGNAGAA